VQDSEHQKERAVAVTPESLLEQQKLKLQKKEAKAKVKGIKKTKKR